MTKTVLLKTLKEFTDAAVKDLIMPVAPQKDDGEPPAGRAADVYMMRLVKSSAAKKAAPYIIHQAITGRDSQAEGERVTSRASVRSIFCVYHEDEQEGGLLLLGLIERLRIELLKEVVIGNRFELDLEDGLDMLIYPDDSKPYYVGEMLSAWKMPAVRREVNF